MNEYYKSLQSSKQICERYKSHLRKIRARAEPIGIILRRWEVASLA